MKSEQINELATALSKAQQTIKSAIKDANNPFYKSKYADLASVWQSCQVALNLNNLSIVQTIEYIESKEYVLVTSLIHNSGQWIRGMCPLINLKGDMQGLGSAISYARRYSIAAICGVVTEDDDAEYAGKNIPKGNSFVNKHTSDLQRAPSDLKASGDKERCTKPQAKMLWKMLSDKGYVGHALKDQLLKWGLTSTDEVAFVRVNEMRDMIENLPQKNDKPYDPSEPPPVDMNIPWPESRR